MPTSTLVFIIASSAVIGAAVYDFIVTVIDNKASSKWTDKKNAPGRLIFWGSIGLAVAAGWVAMSNWPAAITLLATELIVVIGIIWWRRTHKVKVEAKKK